MSGSLAVNSRVVPSGASEHRQRVYPLSDKNLANVWKTRNVRRGAVNVSDYASIAMYGVTKIRATLPAG